VAVAARRRPASASVSRVERIAILAELADKAPDAAVAAAIDALALVVEDQAKAPFVTRSLQAMIQLAEASTRRALLEAAGSTSDTAVLLHALTDSEVLSDLAPEDPLAAARARGALVQQRLLRAEGGVASAEEFGRSLGGLSRQAIDARRKRRKLIALDVGRHGYRYPVWQVQNGAVLPGLERVLAELGESDPWTQMAFFLNPNSWLDSDIPLAALRLGEIDRVVSAAELFAG
jgi:hypothetical protein